TFITASIYAASMTGTVNRLGGTGNVTVNAPSTTAAISNWSLDGDGLVGGVTVTWTPTADSEYDITVTLFDGVTSVGQGTLNVPRTSGTNELESVVTITGSPVPTDFDGSQITIVEVGS